MARVAFVLTALVLIAACTRAPHAAPPLAGAEPDSARGIVQATGSEPLTTLVLTPAAAAEGESLLLRGADTAALRALSGLEVAVFGVRGALVMGALPWPARGFTVHRFVVRAADGVAAHDGVIAVTDGRYYLVSREGVRVEVPFLPARLRSAVGARVYLAGPLTAAPAMYGVISGR